MITLGCPKDTNRVSLLPDLGSIDRKSSMFHCLTGPTVQITLTLMALTGNTYAEARRSTRGTTACKMKPYNEYREKTAGDGDTPLLP